MGSLIRIFISVFEVEKGLEEQPQIIETQTSPTTRSVISPPPIQRSVGNFYIGLYKGCSV